MLSEYKINIGDVVTRDITLNQIDKKYKRAKGVVDYIDPKGVYYRVEFKLGNWIGDPSKTMVIHECYLMREIDKDDPRVNAKLHSNLDVYGL